MPDAIYEIEALRKRALDALRARGAWMGPGEIAAALSVPLWAVVPALESARRGGLAEEGVGGTWRLVAAPEPGSLASSDQVGLDLGDEVRA